MFARQHLAIDLGRRRLRALLATEQRLATRAAPGGRPRGILRIDRVLTDDLPAGIDAQDPVAVGEWVADALRNAGMIGAGRGMLGIRRPRRAIIALSRETIGVKRMMMPTIDDAELPDMVRLAMQRELNFDVENAAIDFLPVRKTESHTIVLAMALPNTALEFTRRMAQHAGLAIDRITLRTLGVAALLQTDPYWNDQPVMIVDVTGDGVEFSVIEDGATRFSRGAELPASLQNAIAVRPAGQDGAENTDATDGDQGSARGRPESLAEHVITEAKRTWMSYRILENAANVKHALVLGDERIVSPVSAALDKLLEVPVAILREHPLIDASAVTVPPADRSLPRPAGHPGDADRDDAPLHDLRSAWPLAGLMLRRVRGLEMINFARPRKSPDLAAQRRMRVLAGVGAAALLVLTGAMYCYTDLIKLQRQYDHASDAYRTAVAEARRFQRDADRYDHLWYWEQAQADWLGHLQYLAQVTAGMTTEATTASAQPSAHGSESASTSPNEMRAVLLNDWTGSINFRGVTWDRSTSEWGAPAEVRVAIDGEARDRATADRFRAQLVEGEQYTVSSTGADAEGGRRLPFGFSYALRARDGQPIAASLTESQPSDDDGVRSAVSSGASEVKP